jgi:hypothetical protein
MWSLVCNAKFDQDRSNSYLSKLIILYDYPFCSLYVLYSRCSTEKMSRGYWDILLWKLSLKETRNLLAGMYLNNIVEGLIFSSNQYPGWFFCFVRSKHFCNLYRAQYQSCVISLIFSTKRIAWVVACVYLFLLHAVLCMGRCMIMD